MTAQCSLLDQFEAPAADPREPGYPTEVDLILHDDRMFVRLEQQAEDRRSKETVVISVAKFLEIADRMRNIQ